MIFRVLLWVLLAYFIYKFVFDFLVPLITASRRFRQQVRDFQQRSQQQDQASQQQPSASPPPTEKAGEYIDFEEIKEK